MEIMRFTGLQRAIEPIVGMHPGGVRRGGAAIASDEGDASRNGAAPLVADLDREPAARRQISTLCGNYRRLTATGKIAKDELHIPIFIADQRNALPVRRPARVPPVELAKTQRQWRGAIGRRDPQLTQLPAMVTGEQDLLPVGRHFGPRAPAGLLAQDLAAVSRIVDRPRPNIASAPSDLIIGDVKDALAGGPPRRVHGLVPGRIIITPDLALSLAQQRARIAQARGADIRNEQVEMPSPMGRHPGDAFPIGRQARFDIDGVREGQLLLATGPAIQPPQLDRIAIVAAEDDAVTVVRNLGLVIVIATRL